MEAGQLTWLWDYAQLKTIETINAMLKVEIETCIDGITQAHKADVALPHVNERTTLVTHGCNLAMHQIETYWVTRLNALETLMGRPFQQHTNGKSTSDILKDIRANNPRR